MDLHFIFRIRVWHLFAMVFAAGIGAVKQFIKNLTNANQAEALPPQTETTKTDSPVG